MSFEKKVLITGASRGIGKAILESFTEQNFYLIGTATSENGIKSIQEVISSNNSSGEGIVLDLNNDESFEHFFSLSLIHI